MDPCLLIKQSNTCILAEKNASGRIIMAGDRRACWGFSQAQSMPRPKVRKRDGILLGGTGDGGLCSLIVDIMPLPELIDDTDIYMHRHFYAAAKRILDQRGYSDEKKSLNIPPDTYAEIVVAANHHLFQVIIQNPTTDSERPTSGGLIVIDELALPYAAGCGSHWAWGSMETSKRLKITNTKERMKLAMNVAFTYSPGVDDKVDFVVED